MSERPDEPISPATGSSREVGPTSEEAVSNRELREVLRDMNQHLGIMDNKLASIREATRPPSRTRRVLSISLKVGAAVFFVLLGYVSWNYMLMKRGQFVDCSDRYFGGIQERLDAAAKANGELAACTTRKCSEEKAAAAQAALAQIAARASTFNECMRGFLPGTATELARDVKRSFER